MQTERSRDIRYLAEHLLNTDLSGLSRREISHLMRISKRLQAQPADANLEDRADLTLGERLADRVADFGGSWTFIIIFGTFLVGWALLNTFVLQRKAFDPYPYVFLNLVLSMLAAVQAPVIMMSQNRQAARDRMTMLRDFDVNLKAENAIASLHKRMEHLTWQTLAGLDDIKRLQRESQPASAADARVPTADVSINEDEHSGS
ncbi:DUF1003 domain-containing protein [Snodgrassella sp. CFCC 13594]|uniref:DUF1003 domain-containing protein n=1 Tax=Snodgrassella sp. CFCC 13594 TaxID=1775559 RepID=UPI0009EF2F8F|nr:DUF1003 domain-containing protein [Snodgrassella sp. CFCC 13594]